MGIDRMLKTPCTIVRRASGEEVEFGQPDHSAEEVETVCAFQQQRRTEHDETGEISDTLWSLYLPHGTEIDSGDALKVNDRTYEVVGEPWSAQEGSRAMWHVEVTCRRTEGPGGS